MAEEHDYEKVLQIDNIEINKANRTIGQFFLHQPYGLTCVAECYLDGTCNFTGGHCLCQPGHAGDTCTVFGYEIFFL